MDLNQLYFDHQVSLIRADRTRSCELRKEHELGASQLAESIGSIQRALGAQAAAGWAILGAKGRAPNASGAEL